MMHTNQTTKLVNTNNYKYERKKIKKKRERREKIDKHKKENTNYKQQEVNLPKVTR